MISFRQLLKKTTRREALKIKLDRSIASGQFFRFKPAKRNNLLRKFYRLTKGISELKLQFRLAALGGTALTLLNTEEAVAQVKLGPFVQKPRIENPLRKAYVAHRFRATAADLDNDGDYDFIASPSYGYVKLFHNIGDAANPIFAEDYIRDQYGSGIYHGSPALADLDGDGDLDLLLGNYSTSRFFVNNGGDLSDGTLAFTLQSGPWDDVNKTGNPLYGITPGNGEQVYNFVNFDGDGDMDLLIGTAYSPYGRYLHYYQNDGNSNFTSGTLPTGPGYFTGSDNYWSSGQIADIDGDAKHDLVVGRRAGDLKFYKGDGTNFNEQTGTQNPFNGIDLGYDSHPILVDIDDDGDTDVIVGYDSNYSERVALAYFENNGNGVFERKESLDNPFDGVFVGGEATANFVDVDGDGQIDALLGGKYGTPLTFYKNNGGSFSKVSGANDPFKDLEFDTQGGAKPVHVDIDDDGDLDLVTGDYYGELTLFLNNDGTLEWQVMDSSNPFFNLGPLRNYSNGNYYSVDLINGSAFIDMVDIDNDGDLDLFSNSGTGKINFYKNVGDKQNPQFEIPEDPTENPLDESYVSEFADGRFGNYRDVTLRFSDLDNDGDLDLLLGGRDGYSKYSINAIYLFENTGTREAPIFGANPVELLISDTYFQPSPSAIDADGDGDLDIFVGNEYGYFEYYANENPPPVTTVNSSVIGYEFESGPVTLDASLTLADSDGDDIISATVTVQNFQPGNEVLAFTPLSPIIGSFNTTTGVLTLSGRAPAAAYQNVLRTVTYNYIGPGPGPTNSGGRTRALDRTISFAAFDQDFTAPPPANRVITISSPVVAPPPEEIIVYNGMSPNGDAFNQFFNIENIQILGPENKVSIFNRWGDKVFEINNYDNDTRRFEGISDSGKELASGVYFYRIEFANGLPELKGYLTLKR